MHVAVTAVEVVDDIKRLKRRNARGKRGAGYIRRGQADLSGCIQFSKSSEISVPSKSELPVGVISEVNP